MRLPYTGGLLREAPPAETLAGLYGLRVDGGNIGAIAQSSSNQLYLAVLPQISLSAASLGRTEQVLTLLPDRNLATEFFPDQVDAYVDVFERSQGSLTGGHVREYLCDREETEDGRRVVVKVTQRVVG